MTKAFGVVMVALVAAAACGDDGGGNGPRDCVTDDETHRHGERWQCGEYLCACDDGVRSLGLDDGADGGGAGGAGGSGAAGSGPLCEADCGRFACQDGACRTFCVRDEHCASGSVCFVPEQLCVIPPN